MADQILIIGAGPTGLMAAFELARRGVSVRIIDAGLDDYTAARMTYAKATLKLLRK